MALRIPGNPGSHVQGQSAGAAPGPGVRMQSEGGRLFVEVDGRRVWLEPQSVALLQGAARALPARVDTAPPAELAAVMSEVRAHRAQLEAIPGVVSVRAGYAFVNGEVSDKAVIVVATDRRVNAESFPKLGYAVEVVPADAYDLLSASNRGGRTEATDWVWPAAVPFIDAIQDEAMTEATEAVRVITYRPPAGASLPEVRGPMTVTCHVSPDAGWRVLRPFLSETQECFLLGMYDFTAPHIYSSVRLLLRDSDIRWTMTLGPNESLANGDPDSTKADDKTEESVNRGLKRVGGARFKTAFAHVGSGQTFASAYHIKVAVRDSRAIWLSSGSWQSSNQPNIDFLAEDADLRELSRFNREWHVSIESRELAQIFETYLEGDFDAASSELEAARLEADASLPALFLPEAALEERGEARGLQVFAPKKFRFSASKPLRVQPILTPDNYMEVVGDLLRKRPTQRLYFQNQSLNPIKRPTLEFQELLQLLADYSNDPELDVRIIFRSIGAVRKKLESLQAVGFNMKRVRLQAGCHTKGVVIDGKVCLVGSHNFTNDGLQFNRDASLLFFDEGIASYYEAIFLHDWNNLARPGMSPELGVLVGDRQEAAPLGFVRVPWSEYAGDD